MDIGGILYVIIILFLFAGLGKLMGSDWRALPAMGLALALAYFLGSLLSLLNWQDAPTVVAVVVMGGFLLRELRLIREALQNGRPKPEDARQEPDSPDTNG